MKKEQPLPPFDFTKFKSQCNGESDSYEDMIARFMDQNFPNIENRVYLHPNLYKLGLLETYHQITNETSVEKCDDNKIFTNISSSEAVSEVAERLCSWAQRNDFMGLFVFKDFKFKDYLSDLKKSKTTMMYYFDGDHDVLALSIKFGVITIQVKYNKPSGNIKTIIGAIEKAWKQSLKDEDAFAKMNRDLDYLEDIPFYRFIAMTTLDEETFKKLPFCDSHRPIANSLVLRQQHMCGREEFDRILHSRIVTNQGKFIFSQHQYKQLCGRYIGARYSVAAFVRDVADQVGSYTDPHKYPQHPQEHRLLFTTEQEKIHHRGALIQLMTGDYGTGKTQMLEIMIKKVLGEDTNERQIAYYICLSNCDMQGKIWNDSHTLGGAANLTSLSDGQAIGNSNNVIHILDMAKLRNQCITDGDTFELNATLKLIEKLHEINKQYRSVTHVFFDEFPVFRLHQDEITGFIQQLENLAVRYPKSFHWFAFNTHQYFLSGGNTSMLYKVLSSHESNSVQYNHLTKCMRMTKNGFKIVQAVRGFFYSDPGFYISETGHVIDGPKPVLCYLPPCKCNQRADPKNCTCLKGRYYDCFVMIFDQFTRGKKIAKKEVAFFADYKSQPGCLEALNEFGVKQHRFFPEELPGGSWEAKLCILCGIRGNVTKAFIKGNTNFRKGSFIWAVSRSLSQIVIVCLPEEEEDYYVDEDLNSPEHNLTEDDKEIYRDEYVKWKRFTQHLIDNNWVEHWPAKQI